MRLFNFDDPVHREANLLLPWYVNGSLDGAERVRVEQHVRECVACSQEVDAQRRLADLICSPEESTQAAHALQRLHGQLRAQEMLNASPLQRWIEALSRHWPVAVIAVQFALLVLLIPANLPDGAAYRTLSNEQAMRAVPESVVVIFDDEVSQSSVTALLRDLHLRVIDGPNSRGAYTLQLTDGTQQAVLDALRGEAHVKFAQPAPGSTRTRH
jgi:anti-sigma factor RsiW